MHTYSQIVLLSFKFLNADFMNSDRLLCEQISVLHTHCNHFFTYVSAYLCTKDVYAKAVEVSIEAH